MPLVLATLAAVLIAVMLGAGSAHAAKVVSGTLGSSGSGAGQVLFGPSGVAVNRDGTGGASAGDVYLVDNHNARIDQFDATGSFVRAFGWGVMAGDLAPYGFDSCTTLTGCQQGQAGDGAGALPGGTGGIAIDQSHGTLYVADQNNTRIDVFSATGTFLGAFGYGVVSGDTAPYALDFCTAVSGCRAGRRGAAAGQFENRIADVAVDPGSGDVYVAEQRNKRISQFKPMISAGVVTGVSFARAFGAGVRTGADQLESCTAATGCRAGVSGGEPAAFDNLQSVAVDSTGAIYAVSTPTGFCRVNQFTDTPCRVQKFTPDGSSVSDFAPGELTITSGAAPASAAALKIAIDPTNDHVFVAQAQGGSVSNVFGIKEFTPSGSLVELSPPGPGISGGSATGLAVGNGGTLYFSTSVLPPSILTPPPAPTASISPVTNAGTTTATFHGSVTPPSGNLDTTYHFEYSTEGIGWSSWPQDGEVDVGSDHVPVSVSQSVTGLQPGATYQVRLVATTGTPFTTATTTFSTGAAAPSTFDANANPVTANKATLRGLINPNNAATTYHFEWGTDTTYGHQVPDFESFTGSGGEAVRVSANITDLQSNTTYHFRIVATNATGTTTGPDQVFRTLSPSGRPNNRGYELVSPPSAEKDGLGVALPMIGTQLEWQASADGQRMLYSLTKGTPGSTAGGDLKYLAQRGPGNWASVQLTPPALIPVPGTKNVKSDTGLYEYASDDLSCQIVESFEPLTPDTPTASIEGGVTNLYRRNVDGSYTLLTNRVPSNPELTARSANWYYVAGASTDCNRILFSTSYQFLPGTSSGVYVWDDGVLSDVGVRPDGSRAPNAGPGGSSGPAASTGLVSANYTISADGSTVVFSGISNSPGDSGKQTVFVRRHGVTTNIAQPAGAPNDNLGTAFQTMSKDGAHVFFTARYGLTSPSSSGGTAGACNSSGGGSATCALYDYRVSDGSLTDVSADNNPNDADGPVVAGVLGASGDGNTVYFAARGQLIAGQGRTYRQNQSSATYNVYRSRAGSRSFVGLLTDTDLTTAQANAALISRMSYWGSRVTPDGQHLLFVSSANVTNYNSHGTQEAYLYDANSDTTVCVSCRSDGRAPIARPGGTFQTIASTPSGPPMMHQPRALSDDGRRVFFTSPDALAAGATDETSKKNVYQWESGQVSLLVNGFSSSDRFQGFLDASADGSDVFITTDKRLVAADTDNLVDVYDLRIDGGFPVPPPPPALCNPLAGACQPGAGPRLPAPLAGSLSFVGGGNVIPAPSGAPPTPRSKKLKLGKVKTVTGTRTRLKVQVPEKGRLRTSGSGLRRSYKTAKKAGSYRVTVRLSRRAQRTLKRKRRVKVRVRVRFTPRKGRAQSIRVHMTFRLHGSKEKGRS